MGIALLLCIFPLCDLFCLHFQTIFPANSITFFLFKN
ncbi:putative signal peptide protein [Puccinia sorghi]|uniref:Putative signal peptide protein n=1 Tax=Puccinia sorghi TaxID=27349 RepID=A0A0L6VIC8_9BASI|nr:putative signal peptide protein [Puccinia sorghi]